MPELSLADLSGETESLLLPFCVRALESQRPDALLRDEKAVALARQMGPDAEWLEQANVSEEVRLAVVLRNREFDRCACDYMARFPQAAVVHTGCGLDARLERVDNGQVEWYDLDLPEVIELRRKVFGSEGARQNLLSGSVHDGAWLNAVSVHRRRPFLFLGGGVSCS